MRKVKEKTKNLKAFIELNHKTFKVFWLPKKIPIIILFTLAIDDKNKGFLEKEKTKAKD